MGREAQTHGDAFLVGLYEDPRPGEAKGPPRGTATAGSLPLAGDPLEPHLHPARLCGFPPCESRRGRAPPGIFWGAGGVFTPLLAPSTPAPGRPARCSSPPQTLGGAPKPGTPQLGGGQQHPPGPSEPKGGSVNHGGGGLREEGGPLHSAPGAAAQSPAAAAPGRAARGGKRGIEQP